MSDEKNTVSRRKALKVIGVVSAAGAMSIYENPAYGQHQHHMASGAKAHQAAKEKPAKARFFTPAEMAAITAISDLIIPTDDQSPGAKEAEVPAFIDLMVSTSPEEVRAHWREGLAAMDKMAQSKQKKNFVDMAASDQVAMLKDLSKNEFDPKTPEEQFFRTIKYLTIDGYYTSEIGIHKDLKYQGNSYAKEFIGCTHPEHQA